MPIRHIFAVDPGDVNNGFCYFKHDSDTKTADTKIMKVMGPKELSDMLKVIWGIGQAKEPDFPGQPNPHGMFFVIENFRSDTLVRGAIFQWNEMLTSQMIGRVKMCAEWMNAPVYMQEPSQVLNPGRKIVFPIFGKLPKHIPDEKSAFIHGVHWMLQKKLIQTIDQVTLFGQEKL